MTEEQIAFLAETLAEEIEQHHDNAIDVDVGLHDLAVHAGAEMAKSGVVHDLIDALERLINPLPGVEKMPPWAYGIAAAALTAARGKTPLAKAVDDAIDAGMASPLAQALKEATHDL